METGSWGTNPQHYINGKASAEEAREYLTNNLDPSKDEFDSEGVGSGPEIDWLRYNMVWPGNYTWDTEQPEGPGWVRHVANYQEFADTIDEKFELLFNSIIVNVQIVDLFQIDPNGDNNAKYAETINRLYAYGYASVWKELAGLELYYQRHRLSGLGVPAPQLYQLVKSQQNAGNTKKLTEYFLSKGDGFAAFRYLMLLKNSDLPKRELKELQVKVGVSLASQVSAEQLDHLTENDAKWLQPLIEAYRSSIQ